MTAGPGVVRLPDHLVIALSPDANPTEHYAARALQEDLKTHFGAAAAITTDASPDSSPTFIVGRLGAHPLLDKHAGDFLRKALDGLPPAESYAVELTGEKTAPRALIAGKGAVGAMYGCFTVSQLIRRDAEGLTLPSPLRIEDYPVMIERGFTGAPRDVSEKSIQMMDCLARCRINACFYHIDGKGGQDSVPPEMREVLEECRKRGIAVYGQVQNWHTNAYLKRPLCPSNEQDVALIRRLFEELAQTGFDGLSFLFDDIGGWMPASVTHPRDCPKCREAFPDLGSAHVFWLRLMKEVAQKHGIQKLQMCPTPYEVFWSKAAEGQGYYPRFKEATDLSDLMMFFCPFAPEHVAEVEEAGLRNYVWWQNGVYAFSNRYGVWGGVNRVEWGWYGGDSPEIVKSVQTIPERTRRAWVCAGGDVTWAVWGNYAWNPGAYDPAQSELAVAEALFGSGAADLYGEAVSHIRRWANRLPTFDGAADEFERETARAQEALDRLRPIIDQTERPGLLPERDRRNYWWLLDKDLRLLCEAAYRPVFQVSRSPGADVPEVALLSRRSGMEVRYTLDGGAPSSASPIYTAPLPLTGVTTIRAQAFANGEPKGGPAQVTIHANAATGCPVRLATAYSPKYPAGGTQALTDGARGTSDWRAGNWQGYEGESLDAVIDLRRSLGIRAIRVAFLQDAGAWIFLPPRVEYAVSDDGVDFRVVAKIDNPIPAQRGGSFVEPFEAQIEETRARYLRVRADNIGVCPDWHGCAGCMAWLFVDEALVNP